MIRAFMSVGLAAVLSACGGSVAGSNAAPASSASVNGTVSGQPVQAKSAVTTITTTTTNGQTVTSWVVGVTTYADACGCIGGADVQDVGLIIGTLGTSIPTGEYSFGPDAGFNPQGASASAQYYAADPSLTPPSTLLEATSGSITVSEISASLVGGSFDISFPSGDRLTGTFSAPTCAVATAAADAAACQ
jgi:hypothetical protein